MFKKTIFALVLLGIVEVLSAALDQLKAKLVEHIANNSSFAYTQHI